MTKFFLSFLLFIIQPSFAQSIDSLTSIIISYGRNHSSWGRPGVYANSETIILKPTPKNDFKITRYFRVGASAGDDGKTFSNDTIELNTKSLETIPKIKIEFWLTQLNTNKENFTSSFIKPQLKPPAKKEIFKAAKKYDLLWMLKGRDADKSDTKKAIKEIQSFYKLDSFLIFKKPTIQDDMIHIDSYNGMRIFVVKNTDTTEYRCQFYQPLGQPINRYKNKDYSTNFKVFNLEANTSAQSFLPGNSIARKMLDVNNINELYIKWYLDNIMDE